MLDRTRSFIFQSGPFDQNNANDLALAKSSNALRFSCIPIEIMIIMKRSPLVLEVQGKRIRFSRLLVIRTNFSDLTAVKKLLKSSYCV